MKLAAYLFVPAVCLGALPALAQNTPAPAKPAPAAKPAPNAPAPAAKPAAEAKPATPAPATATATAAGSAPTPSAAATAAPAAEASATAAPAATEPAAPAAAEPPPVVPAPAAPAAAPPPAKAEPAPAPAAPAAAPEPASLELFAMVAPTVVHGEPANPQLTNSFRRVGIYGEGGVAYRSKYFLDPFISVGYGTLASGKTEIPDANYGGMDHPGGTLNQHLGIWVISPGVTSDIWRFRLRLGIGVAVVVESNRFQGEKNSATQFPLVVQAGLGYNFYQVPRFRLEAELRAVRAAGADVMFWALGVTARGDALTF
ncbi:MAG TPA: hypothetical protein VFK05_33740 [Polyangiaceae bacterium]|nr:hypothetical protein [Polyangiaceae bacterium]